MFLNYIYINYIDAFLILSAFYLCLFYIYNLHQELSVKHIYVVSLSLISFIFLFAFILTFIMPENNNILEEQFKNFRQPIFNDYYGLFFKRFFFYILFLLVLSFRRYYLKFKPIISVEFSLILVFYSLFSSLIMSTFDFGFVFICIEGLSLSTYILIAFPFNRASIEAAIKYMWFSVLSGAFMVVGIYMFFLIAGNLNFFVLSNFLFYLYTAKLSSALFVVKWAVIFVIISFFFKLAAFPFHSWSLDVYEGS